MALIYVLSALALGTTLVRRIPFALYPFEAVAMSVVVGMFSWTWLVFVAELLVPYDLALTIVITLCAAVTVALWRGGGLTWRPLEGGRRSWIVWGIATVLTTVLLWTMYWSHSITHDAKGLWSSGAAWGDYGLHVSIISHINAATSLPNDLSVAAGEKMTYPFLIDLQSAMYMHGGMNLHDSLFWPGLLLTMSICQLLISVGLRLFGRISVGVGGLGMALFIGSAAGTWTAWHDWRKSGQGFFHFLRHLPEDYTQLNGPNAHVTNLLTDAIVPQRSFLFGLGVGLIVFIFLHTYREWAAGAVLERAVAVEDRDAIGTVEPATDTEGTASADDTAPAVDAPVENEIPASADATEPPEPAGVPVVAGDAGRWLLWPAALLVGLMPMAHPHSFLICCAFFAALIVEAGWRKRVAPWSTLRPFIAALVLALPQIIWQQRANDNGSGGHFSLGWMNEPGHFILRYWWANFGLLGIAILAIPFVFRRHRQVFWILPLLLVLLATQIYALQPTEYDNLKLIYWVLIFGGFFIAAFIGEAVRKRKVWLLLVVPLGVFVFVPGALSITREYQMHYAFAYPPDIDMADYISTNTPVDSVVAAAESSTQPAATLAGRRLVAGYSGWLYNFSIPYIPRDNAVKSALMGDYGPVKKYGATYLLASVYPDPAWPTNDTALGQLQVLWRNQAWILYKLP